MFEWFFRVRSNRIVYSLFINLSVWLGCRRRQEKRFVCDSSHCRRQQRSKPVNLWNKRRTFIECSWRDFHYQIYPVDHEIIIPECWRKWSSWIHAATGIWALFSWKLKLALDILLQKVGIKVTYENHGKHRDSQTKFQWNRISIPCIPMIPNRTAQCDKEHRC